MKKTILLSVLAMLCLNFAALAQNTNRITGRVIDSISRTPLKGATIRIKSSLITTLTDENGDFTIDAQAKQGSIVISFIGYNSIEVKFSNDESRPFAISLTENQNALQEVSVVSTGYQTISKERATGSFSQPMKEMYGSRISTDIISKLDGITSGLTFNTNTNNTQSGNIDLNIRGRSTIFANDQPLIIVDNFPYSGDINNINPNDIETVTILKDAAAASIWGVRAGNGVIVFTTKKGKANQTLKISLNSNLTIIDRPNLYYNPTQLNSSDFIEMESFLFTNGKYNSDLRNTTTFRPVSPVVEILALLRAGTITKDVANAQIEALRKNDIRDDLKNYFYQNAVKQQYSVNVSGGGDKTNFYFSTGYDKNQQSIKGNNADRLTINSNITFNPISNLQITTGINYVQANTQTDKTVNNLNTGGLYSNIYPYAKLVDPNGNPLTVTKLYRNSFIQSAPSNGYLDWTYSPLKDLELADRTTKYGDIRLTPSIKYTVFKGLNIEGKYQFEQYTTTGHDFESQETFYTRNLINRYSILQGGKVVGYNIPLGGILNQSLSTVTAYNARGQINYLGSWKKHNIVAIAGIEQSQTKAEGSGFVQYGYDPNTGKSNNVDFLTSFPVHPGSSTNIIPNANGISGSLDRVRSFFGNVAYTFNDTYTASISGRIDGSNYFGVATNQKSVPLWSVGGKWAIDHEKFYKFDWIPTLQLRASYGYNGNLNRNVTGVTTAQYLTRSDWTNLLQANISNIGNPQLMWEKAGIANLGLDFAFKNNIISGSIEFFLKNGQDLIGDASVAPSTGTTVFRGNYASTNGHGIDIQLTSKNLTGSFFWFSTILFSHATDKVTKYTAPITSSYLTTSDGTSSSIYPIEGKPVFGIWSYKWAGLDPATGDPQGYVNGSISKDYYTLENPSDPNNLVYSGSARPLYFGGLNNRFGYKDFTLSINVSYKFDYYFRRSSINYYGLFTNWQGGNKEYSNRWQKPGDEKKTNVPSMIYPADPDRDNYYNFSAITVEKGDNIRLQDVSLSYDFKKSKFPKLPFSGIQVYAYANNIGILWRANKLKLDPDYPTGIPATKTLSFGLKINM